MMKWLRLGLPLVLLVLLGALLARGLQFDPKNLPSALVGKPAPAFSLPTLDGGAAMTPENMRGKVWVLNVFASWCGACVSEHPRLLKLAASNRVTLIGLAYKDRPEDTQQWLKEHGDPFSKIALDMDGKVGINFGVYGVPETYVIDREGIIRYRQVGPIDEDFFDKQVAALMNADQSASKTAKTAQ